MRLIFLAITFFLSYHLHTQDLVIKNVNVVDVENGKMLPQKDVTIVDGLIHSIKDSKGEILANEIDGTDKYLMPGLIDAHIHLFQSGGIYTRPDAIDLRHIVPYNVERQWLYDNAEEILKRYLSQGFTSVIDLGGPMYNLELRDSLNQLKYTAHVYMAGPLISTYLPQQLDVRLPPIIKATDEEMGRQLVRRQMRANPDIIKIWFVILKPQDALDYYSIIKAIIEEAKLHKTPVAIHARELITAKIALELGVDFLVHGVTDVEVDDEFISLLKSTKTVYCPTIQVSSNFDEVVYGEFEISDLDYKIAMAETVGSIMDIGHIANSEDLNYYNSNKSNLLRSQDLKDRTSHNNLRKIHNAGSFVAFGTDAGNIGTLHASSYLREIDLLNSVGFTNAEIIKTATINAARSIKKEAEIGSVNIHKKADLLLLKSNPYESIDNLQDKELIIKNGIPVDLENLMSTSPKEIVQRQLNAYNGHNLEAFLEQYADNVRLFNFPNELLAEGKDWMRKNYSFIENTPLLHGQLLNRTVIGKTVIDHTRVSLRQDEPPYESLVIFRIFQNKISEVYFVRE